MDASLAIPNAEYQARAGKLLDHIKSKDLKGVVLFNHHYVLYLGGFGFIPTERPMAFVMNAAGERALFVPRLELEHAQANGMIERVDHYVEYPHEQHPMQHLATMLAEMGVKTRIGIDQMAIPGCLAIAGRA